MQRQLLGTLLQLDVLEGKDADALKRIEEIRVLQEKPADKLLTGRAGPGHHRRPQVDRQQHLGRIQGGRWRRTSRTR